jgi:hypothetical protein
VYIRRRSPIARIVSLAILIAALAIAGVTIVGGGSPRSQAFPLTIVNAAVPSRLVQAIRRMPGLSDFTPVNATLRKQPFDGHVEWSVTGTGGGRAVNFLAEPAGGRLRRVG